MTIAPAGHPHSATSWSRPSPLVPIAYALAQLRRLRRRPALLLVPCLALLLHSPSGDDASGVHIFPSDIMLAGLVGLVALQLVTTAIGLERLRHGALLLLGAVVVAGTTATMLAVDPGTSLSGLVRVLEIFAIGPLAVALALRTRVDVLLLLAGLVALGVIEGAVGVVQYATGSGASYGGQSVRAVGTFGSYDIMGMATTVRYAIAVCAATALCARSRLRLAATLTGIALLVPLALSLSRGAALAAVVSVAVMALTVSWRTAVALAVTCALGLALVLAGSGPAASRVTERLSSIASSTTAPDQSVQDRYALWAAARQMLADHPWTGVGIKAFPDFRDSTSPMNLSTGSDVSDATHGYRRVELKTPHDLYLLLLAEQGVLGGAAYGGLFVTLLLLSHRHSKKLARARGDGTLQRVTALAGLGCLVSFLMDSIYADIGGASTVLIPLVLGLALWSAMGARLADR